MGSPILEVRDMIQIRKILLSTDFSECSRQALNYALSFARRYEAKLILLHVIEADEYIAYAEESAVESSSDIREEIIRAMEETASESFEQFLSDFSLEGIEFETKMAEGTSFVEIAKVAKESEADMIVIGTHGRQETMKGVSGARQSVYTRSEHSLFGSTAERVVRQAHCPVLSVKPGGRQFV